MSKNKIFIGLRASGDFGATHEGGKQAGITGQTQGQVIQQTEANYSDATVHVARIRNAGPGPNKYRKV